MPKEFICKNVMPGLTCNLPEMTVLGCLFVLVGCVCFYFAFIHIKSKLRNHDKIIDLISLFWIFMQIFMFYRGIIQIFYFPYSEASLLIVHGGVNSTLALIPISLFVLLIVELLFTYRNPGLQTVKFYRVVFIVFLSVFLVVGVALSWVGVEDEDYTNDLSLWHACTDLLVVIFVAVPASHLIAAVSYPVIQPEDASFVKWSVVGIWVFGITFFLRSIFNLLHYIGKNPIITWFQRELQASSDRPTQNARIFQFFFTFIFEWFTSVMTMIGVYYLRKHDLKFSDDPFYARASTNRLLGSSK